MVMRKQFADKKTSLISEDIFHILLNFRNQQLRAETIQLIQKQNKKKKKIEIKNVRQKKEEI